MGPRPVQYGRCSYDPPGTKNCPIDPPYCNGGQLIRSEVKGEEATINHGRFVVVQNPELPSETITKFEIVPKQSTVPVSKIFEFTWCPAQDKFQVTVYKQGNADTGFPYQFRSQTHNVVALQSEKAVLQAEIDQLKAEKTGTIKVVFV